MKLLAVLTAVMLVLIVGMAVVSGGPDGSTPSAIAIDEIPPELLDVYVQAAATCPGLPWQVLAAIGFIESRHAQGRADPATGDVSPPILGPALDGTNGYARIPDPASADGWAHAQGPMQFIPSTWASWGRLAPGRPAGATASPQNAWDAIYSAAAYLCGGRDRLEDLEAAILSYNNSRQYLEDVLAKAVEYGLGVGSAVVLPGGWALPGPRELIDRNPSALSKPHHDYPAWDWGIPAGSPIYAVRGGSVTSVSTYGGNCYGASSCQRCGIGVTITDDVGASWTYCHGSALMVNQGQTVATGQQILASGNSGNSTGAHLHLGLSVGGAKRCPQHLLVSLYERGAGLDPRTLPASGCST